MNSNINDSANKMDQKKKSANKNSAAPNIKDLDARQRKLAILKQKQCDAIALHIVNKLIDCPVTEDVFLQSLKYMNQCHYQDIVEERAISKMCGYPVCGNAIPDMPKKQYHISTKSNKIFDITDRKNYCSNYCYNAGKYIKEQMLTSPLWFRDKEEIPDFHLLSKSATGVPGEEVDQGIVKLDITANEKFTSTSEFTQDAINEVGNTIGDKLNVTSQNKNDNELINTNQQSTRKESVLKITEEKETAYPNLFMPNLVDILKENAKYFDNQINSEPKESQEGSSDSQKLNIEANIKETTQKHFDQKITDKSILNVNEKKKDSTGNCKQYENSTNNSKSIKTSKTFDRTIINTKSTDNINTSPVKLKGILSKSSKINNKSENKKQVSFSMHNTEKYIRNDSDSSQKLQKTASKTSENSKLKNMNLIGNVREKSDIYKYEMSCINISPNEYNANLKHENNFCVNYKEIEEIINPTKIDENSTVINSIDDKNGVEDEQNDLNKIEKHKLNDSKSVYDEEKENRISKLRNSSTFRKASKIFQMNKNEIKNSNFGSLKNRLKKYIREWFTYNTILFLYGEKIKEKISTEVLDEYNEKKTAAQLDEAKQKQYNSICKRLNLMELADRKFDESVTGKKLRPLPRYEELQKQAETIDLKVQAFYTGCSEIFEEDAESETESVKDEDVQVEGAPAVLPLVESKDIVPLRKRIFLTSLSRIIPNICEILKQCPNYLLSDLKKLIDTFELSADNIVFKTSEWNLVGIILVKMLSIRDNSLKTVMEEEEVNTYIKTLLYQYNMKTDNLQEIFLNDTETCILLEKCLSKTN